MYNKTIEEVYKAVDSNQKGLSEEQVKLRQSQDGLNELKAGKQEHILAVFLSQFTDFLVIILLVAGFISLLLKDIESAIVIIAVTVLNAILGTTQHIKAGKALEGLKSLSAPIAKVLRNGQKTEIPSKEVVVGDIMFLEAGDYICADGRIIENYSLQVNESSLTGESISVTKVMDQILNDNVTVGDRKNMVFTSGLVTYGRGTVIVTQIGMQTEIGKIASLLESAQVKKTPLQVNLDVFGKKLAVVILFLCALIFAINLMRGYPLGESFLFAVALAVAAIPEALSSIVTIVLAIGTQKMAKEHAIIRKLHAVESLGGVSVICSDKTGTLTQNKMVVKSISIGIDVLEADKLDIKNIYHKQFLECITLCNDAVNSNDKEIGDPTEIALINMSKTYGINEQELRKSIPRISELPFDSERKLMSTVHKHTNGITLITKGAIDVILSKATKISQNSSIRSITEEDKKNILNINQNYSQSGLRVLGLASKIINSSNALTFSEENELVFIGLIAMEDPPRLESKQAVYECRVAGIKPVMITGDHKITAIAIARQIGILKDDSEAVEGVDLDLVSDDDLKILVTKLSVYARVSPAHKIRIVKAWQQLGFLVAMTGDGVNDAPALKQADIGIAMGKVGTEVAKESSDMILTDDNFATIVKAISNGRSIYTNIKHSIFFLLSGNMAGILAVVYTSILALPLPFTAVHLLFINLLTDSMPAIALGLEAPNKAAMEEAPRDVKESILTKRFIFETFLQGAIIAAATLYSFYHGLAVSVSLGCTMAFSTLTLSRLIHGFNCRSNFPLYKIGFFTNKYQWLAMIIGTSCLLLVLLYPPLQQVFKVSQDIPNHLIEVLVASLMPLIIIQGYKTIYDYKPFNIKFSI
jgi:Ca2+-transporting ATPase